VLRKLEVGFEQRNVAIFVRDLADIVDNVVARDCRRWSTILIVPKDGDIGGFVDGHEG